jgi:hypothetical protein
MINKDFDECRRERALELAISSNAGQFYDNEGRSSIDHQENRNSS